MSIGINPFFSQMNVPAAPTVTVHRFYTTYEPVYNSRPVVNSITGQAFKVAEQTDETREVDWVVFSPVGQSKVVISEKVDRILSVLPLDGDGADQNPAIMQAHIRKAAIQPLYENWKRGKDPMTDGTPLAAWNGLGPEQAQALKMHNIHSVEQLSSLSDLHFQQIRIPNLRFVVENARRFLAARSQNTLAQALAEKDVQISAMGTQMETMREVMEAMQRQLAELQAVGRAGPIVNVGGQMLEIGSSEGGGYEPGPAAQGGVGVVGVETGEHGAEENGQGEPLFAGEDDTGETAPRRSRRPR